MVVSSRAIVAVGLGLVGMGILAGPSQVRAQSPGDPALKKSAAAVATPAQAPAAAAKPIQPPDPAIFGTVDIEAVFKGYDKVKVQSEEFKAAAMAKHNMLMKIQNERQVEVEKLSKFTPNSIDAKKADDRITQLKAQIEAGREQAEREFAAREAEMLATLYKEVQDMVSRIAQYRKMTYVVQYSNEPISGTNPQSVMTALARPMVYADPRNDITKDVIHNLNRQYKALSGGTSRANPAAAHPAGN